MSYILNLSGRFNTLIFFFKNTLVIINPLHFRTHFIMKYQFSYKKKHKPKKPLGFFFLLKFQQIYRSNWRKLTSSVFQSKYLV